MSKLSWSKHIRLKARELNNKFNGSRNSPLWVSLWSDFEISFAKNYETFGVLVSKVLDIKKNKAAHLPESKSEISKKQINITIGLKYPTENNFTDQMPPKSWKSLGPIKQRIQSKAKLHWNPFICFLFVLSPQTLINFFGTNTNTLHVNPIRSLRIILLCEWFI